MPEAITRPDTLDKRKEMELIVSGLEKERKTFSSHWRMLADFVKPRRQRWFTGDSNRGDRRNSNIIDSTASFAHRTLQSGMHAGITSPARPWMRLTTPDPELAEFGPVKEWLHTVTERMRAVFIQTNLYHALPVIYGDMSLFATAALAVVEDPQTLFRCYTYPIGSFSLGVDPQQRVNTFVRQYRLNVRQVVEEFGVIPGTRMVDWSNITQTVRTAWDRAEYTQGVDIVWVVAPNRDWNPNRLGPKFHRWISCYYEAERMDKSRGDFRFLRQGGYNEFPIMAPRWDVTAEDTYGTDCPGMTALGDIRQLQVMVRRKAQAVEKYVNPPLVGPGHLRNQPVSSLPGDVTYSDIREGQQQLRAIYEQRLSINEVRQDVQETRFMIERAFYADLFLMLSQTDRREITAREVDERHEEKLLALGPVLERTNDELLDPLIDRVFSMMARAGFIPPPPPDIQGMALKVEYTSIMHQAQKLVGVTGVDRFMQSAMVASEVFPEVRHKVDVFQVVDDWGEMLGVNPKIIVPDEDALAALEAEQQALKDQMEAEQLRQIAGSAKDLSQAPLDKNTALDGILESVGS